MIRHEGLMMIHTGSVGLVRAAAPVWRRADKTAARRVHDPIMNPFMIRQVGFTVTELVGRLPRRST